MRAGAVDVVDEANAPAQYGAVKRGATLYCSLHPEFKS